MFCPRCGQQQISDEIRYCSRCGLGLIAISEVLGTDGVVRSSAKETRRAGLIGFGLVTVSLIFLFATLILGTPEPGFIVQMNLLIALLVYLFALGYVLSKFRKRRFPADSEPVHQLGSERVATTKNLLKEQDLTAFVSADAAIKNERPETTPTSVTESTTVLLKED